MNASTTIDADRVQALNRLIREKTGRADQGAEPVAAPRKNLWLQVPPAAGDRPVRTPRRPVRRAAATGTSAPVAGRGSTAGHRIRRLLTLVLSAALLLATAATAVDLLTAEHSAQLQKMPAPTLERTTVTLPVTGRDREVRDLRSENQRLRERLRALDRRLDEAPGNLPGSG